MTDLPPLDLRPKDPAQGKSKADGDEWTRVTRKGSRHYRVKQSASFPTSHLAHLSDPSTLLPPSLTVEQIAAQHARFRSQWRSQPSHEALARLIGSNMADHADIDQAICLGNASFDPPGRIHDRIRCAHVQTEAFLAIVDLLNSTRNGRPIPCFFQEPQYTDTDESFLANLGHTVIQTPAAFDMVTPKTFVFGIHLYGPDYAKLLAATYPAMFVGTTWERFDEILSADSVKATDLDRLREMDERFDKFDFPQTRGNHDFSDTCIYWKRRSEET